MSCGPWTLAARLLYPSLSASSSFSRFIYDSTDSCLESHSHIQNRITRQTATLKSLITIELLPVMLQSAPGCRLVVLYLNTALHCIIQATVQFPASLLLSSLQPHSARLRYFTAMRRTHLHTAILQHILSHKCKPKQMHLDVHANWNTLKMAESGVVEFEKTCTCSSFLVKSCGSGLHLQLRP